LISFELGSYGYLNTDSIAEQTLRVYDLGTETRRNETYCYENKDRDYEGYLFQYTLDGYGIYERKGERYKLTKGKAFFIHFPEDSRYYLNPSEDPNQTWTYFYLHFIGPAAEPFFRRIQELSGPVIDLAHDSMPVTLFFEIYNTLKSQKPMEHYYSSEWLYRFLVSLLRYVEFPKSGNSSPYVAAAMEWMSKNYGRQAALLEMGREMGITYSHLERLFRKEQGISPVRYLTQLRLEQSMKLLQNTGLGLDEIAEQCGFSCANYFAKVYKKVLHITPAEFRRQHKLDPLCPLGTHIEITVQG
jgi:AraC-like DNA-binding protein